MKKILILLLFSITSFAQTVNVIEIPNWYKNATNMADWWKQPNFPKVQLPAGKKGMMEGDNDYSATKANFTDYGFSKEYRVVNDDVYMNGQSNNADVWDVGAFLNEYRDGKTIVLADFEGVSGGEKVNRFGNQAKVNAFAERVKAIKPDAQIGLWGIGNIDRNPLWQWGTYDLNSANYWKGQYSNVTWARGFNRYNVSNPLCYDENIGTRHVFNTLVQQMEVHRLHYGFYKNYPSFWNRSENINHIVGVDKSPNMRIDYKKPDGKLEINDWLYKPLIGSQYFLKSVLWSILLADGYHFWGTEEHQTDDPSATVHLFPTPARIQECISKGLPYNSPKAKTENGNTYNVNTYYHPQWEGSYNFVYLGNWMVSQQPIKGIIEANTPVLPVSFGKGDAITYTGDATYPSFVELNKTPMIRIKYSQDGTKVLFLAHNEYQKALETTTWSISDKNWKVKIELKGNHPTFGWIDLQ